MVYDILDEYLLGGAQWGWTDDWTPTNHDGWNQENFSITDQRRQIRSNFAIRAYPRAIAGIPGMFRVNRLVLSMQIRALPEPEPCLTQCHHSCRQFRALPCFTPLLQRLILRRQRNQSCPPAVHPSSSCHEKGLTWGQIVVCLCNVLETNGP